MNIFVQRLAMHSGGNLLILTLAANLHPQKNPYYVMSQWTPRHPRHTSDLRRTPKCKSWA